MTTTTHTVHLDGIGPVDLTVEESGAGRPVLLLHGGGGPATVSPFAEALSTSHPARALVPTHPGFGGTPRPAGLDSVPLLADLYLTLLEDLDLTDVLVVGSSIGGWLAAEIATRNPARVSGVVLVDAVGLDVPGHPVADFFALSPEELATLSWADPTGRAIDPATLPEAARAVLLGNRSAIETYAGRAMVDTTLGDRLPGVAVPTLVLWGAADGIVDLAVAHAFAALAPGSRLEVIGDAGHLPHLEQPDAALRIVRDFAEEHALRADVR